MQGKVVYHFPVKVYCLHLLVYDQVFGIKKGHGYGYSFWQVALGFIDHEVHIDAVSGPPDISVRIGKKLRLCFGPFTGYVKVCKRIALVWIK